MGCTVLVAHLGDGKKMANIERDPRVVVSFTVDGAIAMGLHHTRCCTEFPTMDNPPPGRIAHIAVDRAVGVRPWVVN